MRCRYHGSDVYGDDKLTCTVRRGSMPPSPTPSRSSGGHLRPSRLTTATTPSTPVPTTAHHKTTSRHPPAASNSGSDTPSSSRSSSSSSTSSSSSSSSSRSRSYRSSRSVSRSPPPTRNHVPAVGGALSTATDKRPLAICVRNLPVVSTGRYD